MRQVMTAVDILSLLSDIKEDVSFDTNRQIITFDTSMSMLDARHQNKSYIQEFTIGVRELLVTSTAEYPMKEAMIPIVNLFHEVLGHGGQLEREFNRNMPISKVLALNYYACQGSNYYYEGFGPFDSTQYWNQPHEIAAQYIGIKSAYCYLSQKWGQEMATEAICAYESFRQDNKCAFLDNTKRYTDVENILTDLNEKFQKCVYMNRHYSHMAAKRFPADSLLHLAVMKNDFSYINRVERCHNGLKLDWMMTSAYVWHRDYNHVIREKPVFADMILDPDEVFRYWNQPIRPKPTRSNLDLRRLDITKEIQELDMSLTQLQL